MEVRAGLNGETDTLGFKHWEWLGQGVRGQDAWIRLQTRQTKIELGMAENLSMTVAGRRSRVAACNGHNHPTLVASSKVNVGEAATVTKWNTLYTSRDVKNPVKMARSTLKKTSSQTWDQLWEAHSKAWESEWERSDVVIEGDDEAQLAIRFNIFQLLIAAPRHDVRVNLGAKTLSGYGYRNVAELSRRS